VFRDQQLYCTLVTAGTAMADDGSAAMFEDKIHSGEELTRSDRRQIKRAYHGSRGSRSSGLRIVTLMVLAVAGVLGLSQGVLAVSGETGERFTEELVVGGQG